MWVEETKGARINHERCRQAQGVAEQTGSELVAANCPFCIQMFDDGIPSVEADEEKRMKTLDVAEILELAVFGANGSKAPEPEPAEAAAEGGS
jgi:Fe-S oxidoreductase